MKVKDHGVKAKVGETGAGGHMFGTMDESIVRQKILAEEMGISFDRYRNFWFLVTKEGKPMVVESLKKSSINNIKAILKENGIAPVILFNHMFTGVWCESIHAIQRDIWSKYRSNAKLGISPEDAVRAIVNASEGITALQ